jgi:hypothetical protein
MTSSPQAPRDALLRRVARRLHHATIGLLVLALVGAIRLAGLMWGLALWIGGVGHGLQRAIRPRAVNRRREDRPPC